MDLEEFNNLPQYLRVGISERFKNEGGKVCCGSNKIDFDQFLITLKLEEIMSTTDDKNLALWEEKVSLKKGERSRIDNQVFRINGKNLLFREGKILHNGIPLLKSQAIEDFSTVSLSDSKSTVYDRLTIRGYKFLFSIKKGKKSVEEKEA